MLESNVIIGVIIFAIGFILGQSWSSAHQLRRLTSKIASLEALVEQQHPAPKKVSRRKKASKAKEIEYVEIEGRVWEVRYPEVQGFTEQQTLF